MKHDKNMSVTENQFLSSFQNFDHSYMYTRNRGSNTVVTTYSIVCRHSNICNINIWLYFATFFCRND